VKPKERKKKNGMRKYIYLLWLQLRKEEEKKKGGAARIFSEGGKKG